MMTDQPKGLTRSEAPPLILGHRGASALAPENTLVAFARAMHEGANGIEFDVRLARDQVPVVIHDASLKRTGSIDRLVKDLTAAELQQIDVGRWFDSRAPAGATSFAGETLPTLSQVFDLFSANSGLLYVELKCSGPEGPALAAAVARLTRSSGMAERTIIESFNLAALGEIKRNDPGLRTAALFEPQLSRPIASLRRGTLVETARRVAADEIALHHTLAGPRLVEQARLAGLEVVVWTVDDPVWLKRAATRGIKALICNDPGLMLRYRNPRSSS
jgi:glycerophosphoryl diester phosphodiesterase